MANRIWAGGRLSQRGLAAGVVLAALVAVTYAVASAGLGSPAGAHSTPTVPAGSAVAASPTSPSAGASAPTSSPSPTPGASVGPTPPTVVDVPAPLTGRLVDPAAIRRPVIAVMIDDHEGARPQSGFNSAAIVYQAPAEGGIPRYMLVFQDQVPSAVGPIRSARQYYIEWAAGYDAMYVHFGGSSQALTTLRAEGHGGLVWNADGFRWSPTYMWRNHDRPAPHNVYTDGTHLEALARRIGVPRTTVSPTWTFEEMTAPTRPLGNTITVVYPYESITFKYDPNRDAYLRYINGSKKPEVDAADHQVVAPANVVVIRMHFGPLTANDPHHRLEAADVGHGDAWISTAGRTIHGTWKKAAANAPLLLFDGSGRPAVLSPGQTFVEVLSLAYSYSIHQGQLLPPPDRDLEARLAPF